MNDRHADFTNWYAAEADGLARVLALVVGNTEFAREATAEAFARAWARWDRVATMESRTGWVYKVALNVARTRLRRQNRDLSRAYTLNNEDGITPAELDDELWDAVRALPPRARLAVALRYIADLPEADIAKLMRVSRGTVARTLSDARRRLAIALAPPKECRA